MVGAEVFTESFCQVYDYLFHSANMAKLSQFFHNLHDSAFSESELGQALGRGSGGTGILDGALSQAGMYILVIAYAIFIFNMCHQVFEQAMVRRGFSFAGVLKLTLIGCVTILLMHHTRQVTDILLDFGDVTISASTSVNPLLDNSRNHENFREALKGIDILTGIGLFTRCLPYWLMANIDRMFIYYIAITRAIQLLVMEMFMPIPCAYLVDGGLNSQAGSYIKKYLALVLQITILIWIQMMAQQIISYVTSPSGGSTYYDPFTTYFTIGFGAGGATITPNRAANFVKAMTNTNFRSWTVFAVLLTKLGLQIKSLALCNELVGA